MGGVDSDQDGIWEWTDGTPFDFTYWGSGEPAGGKEFMFLDTFDDWRWHSVTRLLAYSFCQLIY